MYVVSIYSSLQSALKALQSSLEQSAGQLREREASASLLQGQASRLRADLQEREGAVSALEAELERARARGSDGEVAMATQQEENRELRKQVSLLEGKAASRYIHMYVHVHVRNKNACMYICQGYNGFLFVLFLLCF